MYVAKALSLDKFLVVDSALVKNALKYVIAIAYTSSYLLRQGSFQ